MGKSVGRKDVEAHGAALLARRGGHVAPATGGGDDAIKTIKELYEAWTKKKREDYLNQPFERERAKWQALVVGKSRTADGIFSGSDDGALLCTGVCEKIVRPKISPGGFFWAEK